MLAVTNLAGFMRPAGLRIRSQVLTATSTTHQIVIPAAALPGDFCILGDMGGSVGEPTDVLPTDFTSLQTEGDGSTTRGRVSGKILVSGDPGSTITGINATADAKTMFVFRGSSPFKGFTGSTWNEQITGGNPTGQNVAAAGVKTPVIVFGIAGEADDGTAAFSTASPAFDDTLSPAGTHLIMGYKIYNGGPADHSIDMNDLGNANFLASGYVILF